MRDDDHGALKALEIVFQDLERRDIQVVGRLVEQQHVRRGHQHARQIQPPLFAARQALHRRILHVRREEELLEHLGGGEASVGRLHVFRDVAHVIDQPQLGVDLREFLRKETHAHRVADCDAPLVGRKLAGEQAQQRRLAAAVFADHSHALVAQNGVGEAREELPPAHPLAGVFAFDDLAAQPRACRAEGHPGLGLRALDGAHLLKALDARLLLRAPGLRTPADPLQLPPQNGAALARLRVFHVQPCSLLLEIVGKIAVVQVQLSPAQLRDARADAVKEVAVVRDHHQCATVGRKPPLEPGDGLCVDVVGRLVEQQQVDGPDQRRRQRDALFLPARKRAHVAVKVRDAQLCQQRLRLVGVRRADVLRAVPEHLLDARSRLIVARHLRQVGDAQAVSSRDRAGVRLLLPAEQLEQRRLARAVDAHHADAVVLADIERRVRDELFEGIAFCEVFRR